MDVRAVVDRATVLVFDFDGTLVDSNHIKWQAFEFVFRNFPAQLAEIVDYCRGANHTVRDAKFRHVYEKILRQPYTPEIEAALHEEFETQTTAAITVAAEVPGAREFLSLVNGRKTVGVLSSTPHDVLVRILDHRGWREYFDVVQGAPVDKAEWLRRYQQQHELAADDVVFFGDTPEDGKAARDARWNFVAVGGTGLTGPDDVRLHLEDFAVLVSTRRNTNDIGRNV